MGRKKKMPDSFRSEFVIEVIDTPFHNQTNGKKDLMNRKDIAGVYFEVRPGEDEIFIVLSRANKLDFAIRDYNFLKHSLKQRYGKISEIQIWGRIYERGKAKWIPLTSDNVFLFNWEHLRESFK